MSYEKEVDVDKLNKYLKMTGIISNVFGAQQTVKETRIKQYNTLALPAMLHGSANWTNWLRAGCNPLSTGILYGRLQSDDTRGCNNTICPPEDEQGTARNMLRIVL